MCYAMYKQRMGMKILGSFHDNGKKINEDIVYDKDIDEAKKELLHIEYMGKYYEWFMILDGFADYDYQAEYTVLDKKPNGKIYKLEPFSVYMSRIACECGADSVGHPGHSFWCPKWVKY